MTFEVVSLILGTLISILTFIVLVIKFKNNPVNNQPTETSNNLFSAILEGIKEDIHQIQKQIDELFSLVRGDKEEVMSLIQGKNGLTERMIKAEEFQKNCPLKGKNKHN